MDYLCANFSLPRPVCSRLRPDVRDRRTSDAHHRLMPLPYGRRHNNRRSRLDKTNVVSSRSGLPARTRLRECERQAAVGRLLRASANGPRSIKAYVCRRSRRADAVVTTCIRLQLRRATAIRRTIRHILVAALRPKNCK